MLARTLKQFMNLGEISQKQMPEILVLVLYPAVEPLVAKYILKDYANAVDNVCMSGVLKQPTSRS